MRAEIGPDFRPHYTFGDAYPASERAHVNWELSAPVWHTAQMGSTTHREVAKLDRVPLPVEAARVAATGWQVTRTAVRFIGRLPRKGPWQQKVIKELPQTFADLGPTCVKFGQIIASSPGAFGESLSREFRGLLDRVPPAKTDEVHKLFVEELGDEPAGCSPPSRKSRSRRRPSPRCTTRPCAAARRWWSRSSGRASAAALPPTCRSQALAQTVELAKLGRRLSAQDVVADFADNLAEELDFRLEAQSMEAWVSHLHASPLGKNIRVPQVHWDFTTERVLTMERVHGIRIDNAAAIRKAGFDGVELVKALLFSVFEGGLRHGLFHGDLHAGNLYVDEAGRIVFFDFGIMGRIDPGNRWLLRELVYALLVKKDHAAAGKIVVLMGAVGTMKPETQAAKDLERFATPLTMQSLGDMSYADIGRQLSALADAYDVKLPRELVLIGKQFLYVERYMKLLAPRWQMMSDPQLTGYFANFMVEVSREHQSDIEV
ncbi:hypothetical protein J113_04605 [Mycobacterium tuberculosis CAS/NITR204]|uniref:ABC1 atypical kinase-like domain-containing protein n=1 Tax=Mycobacterium tuberculosis CAS/NITR204 TaxID=1310114 RepID=R4M5P6_MYCTX|nr:hypothetical protein J113_04605 [Mycobacterium tuberculosis CAS/NITR204]